MRQEMWSQFAPDTTPTKLLNAKQQRAMLTIQAAAKLAVSARCYRDDAVAEFQRVWEMVEAEATNTRKTVAKKEHDDR
jgi:hypothetical protein